MMDYLQNPKALTKKTFRRSKHFPTWCSWEPILYPARYRAAVQSAEIGEQNHKILNYSRSGSLELSNSADIKAMGLFQIICYSCMASYSILRVRRPRDSVSLRQHGITIGSAPKQANFPRGEISRIIRFAVARWMEMSTSQNTYTRPRKGSLTIHRFMWIVPQILPGSFL